MVKHVLHNYVPWRSQNSLWYEALADLEALQARVKDQEQRIADLEAQLQDEKEEETP
jgi:hypothetical protein